MILIYGPNGLNLGLASTGPGLINFYLSISMYPDFNLGSHCRSITSLSVEAQTWFDRGLNWCYGFNQEEGVKCFTYALEHDSSCAMAHWGVAYAAGPFYNFPWCDFSKAELEQCTRLGYDHVQQALELLSGTSETETALVRALAFRFQKNHPVSQQEFNRWDDDYANAMRKVYHQFPDDLDIAALFIEAMMTRTPWKLWNVKTNQPADNADTVECLEVLEMAIEQCRRENLPHHLAILHLHIHVLEMSPQPEQALVSADRLGTLCPDAGHINHMPAHIYVLCGQYDKAKAASIKAIKADRMYLEYAGPYNFYTTARCHDLHMMMYTCMFLGQFSPALEASSEMCETLTPDVISDESRPQMCITMEGYYSMKMHVLVRFGKWQEIINTLMPAPPDLYCVSTAMHHYARTVAYAALGHFKEAERARELFRISVRSIPPGRRFFNNSAHEILDIAEKMMDGELNYHQGRHDVAFQHLIEGVERNDNLAYSEPWAWMHPPRHALGALLLEQKRYEQAEDVYRTDLGLNNKLQRCAQHQDNIWSLHGLAECLKYRGASDELEQISSKLQKVAVLADIPITASCYCRRKTV